MEEREPSYIAGGNVNSCNHYGKQYKVPQNTKKTVAILSRNHIPGPIPRQNCNLKRQMHPYVFSSTIPSSQNM